jgi:hypothetical protein
VLSLRDNAGRFLGKGFRVRSLSIEHGVVSPEVAHRLERVGRTVRDLAEQGRITNLDTNVDFDWTHYTFDADDSEEDAIIDGLVDVARAQDPSWNVKAGEGVCVHQRDSRML